MKNDRCVMNVGYCVRWCAFGTWYIAFAMWYTFGVIYFAFAKCDMLCSAQRYVFNITYEFRNVGYCVLDGPQETFFICFEYNRNNYDGVGYCVLDCPPRNGLCFVILNKITQQIDTLSILIVANNKIQRNGPSRTPVPTIYYFARDNKKERTIRSIINLFVRSVLLCQQQTTKERNN